MGARSHADLTLTSRALPAPRDVLAWADHVMFTIELPAGVKPPTLQEVEDRYVAAVVKRCGGNISEAARVLGIYRSSLQRKMRKRPLARLLGMPAPPISRPRWREDA